MPIVKINARILMPSFIDGAQQYCQLNSLAEYDINVLPEQIVYFNQILGHFSP